MIRYRSFMDEGFPQIVIFKEKKEEEAGKKPKPVLRVENYNSIIDVKEPSSDYITFLIDFYFDVSFAVFDIQFNQTSVPDELIEVIDENRRKTLKFLWKNLKDFHIFDISTLTIHCDEGVCKVLFKISKEMKTTMQKKKLLPDYSNDDTLRRLFKSDFQTTGALSIQENSLLQSLRTYYCESLSERISSLRHFEMLRYSLKIERMEECKEFESMESLVISNVQFKSVGQDSYSFKYNPKLLEEFSENLNDFSLEIMTMESFDKNLNPETFAITGYDETTIKFRTRKRFDDQVLYHINIVPSSMSYRRSLNALNLLRNYNMESLFNNFEKLSQLKGCPNEDLLGQFSRLSVFERQFQYFNDRIKSNEEQMLAVKQIVQKNNFNYPFVVFGPPGTGKTTVIVESIAQIIKRDQNARILVTSQSNYACDEIGIRLLKCIPRGKIYRHYSRNREAKLDQLPPELLKISNLSGKNFRDSITIEEFYHFNIFIVTLMASANFIEEVPRKNFDYVFIDECGAAAETDILIPITGFVLDHFQIKSKLVLFGDHKQLGPVVKSEFAEKLGLGVSLLERIMHTKHYKEDDSKYKVQLLDNYRSHPKILEVPNKMFYDSKLRSKISKEEAEFAVGWKFLPNKEIPIILDSVNGFCSKEGHSYFNKAEIDEVKYYVDSLLKFGINGKEVTEKDIGIVTPYRAQLKKLEQKFRQSKGIEIGTAELYQGREKKIIIMTTVKSRSHQIGFLANEKRLNVMLTRAQYLLIVICDTKVLQKDPQWQDFIEYCVKNQLFVGNKIEGRKKIETFKDEVIKKDPASKIIFNDEIPVSNSIDKSVIDKFDKLIAQAELEETETQTDAEMVLNLKILR